MPGYALIAVVAGVALFALTTELTRRRRLSERYSILWFATAVGVFAVGVIPGALDGIARLLGIAYAPAALLLVAFLFSLALILHLSMVVSQMTEQMTRLAQTVAIMRSENPHAVAQEEPDLNAVADETGLTRRGRLN